LELDHFGRKPLDPSRAKIDSLPTAAAGYPPMFGQVSRPQPQASTPTFGQVS